MRQKGESISLAERLNNALAQLHSQKIQFSLERQEIIAQMEKIKDENEQLKIKIKQLKKYHREIELGQNKQAQNDSQMEQCLAKIWHYLSRVQQSSKQLTQVASQCRVFDAELEKASVQIQRNINKSSNGLIKYVQQLMKRWMKRQTLNVQNERLQNQNKYLFELTTKLQQNFRQTDKLIKHLQKGDINKSEAYTQELKARINQLQDQNKNNKESTGSKRQGMIQLEDKILRLSDKVKNLEQENNTIKNIHQRTMKKLERLESKSKDVGQKYEGEGIQEERRNWLQKNEEMYEQIRRLNKQLLLSEQSEKKVRDQLSGCLQIYGQWQQQRQQAKHEIQELKIGIQTYLKKIEQVENLIVEKKGQVEAMNQRLETSEADKQKIVSVYQLEVQELNDQLFKKQDIISEIETIMNREHFKHEEIKKNHTQNIKALHTAEQTLIKRNKDIADLKNELAKKQEDNLILKEQIKRLEESIKLVKKQFQQQKIRIDLAVLSERQQKQEMAEIMDELKEQFYNSKKQTNKYQQKIQDLQQLHHSIKQELKGLINQSNETLDIWDLVALIRDKIKSLLQDYSSLKIAHKNLTIQSANRNTESEKMIQDLSKGYESLTEHLANEKRNQQADLSIYKMKIVKKNICSQHELLKITSFKQITQVIINMYQQNFSNTKDNKDKDSSDDLNLKLKKQLVQKERNEISIKENCNVLEAQNIKVLQSLNQLQAEKEKIQEEYTKIIRQLQQERAISNQLREQLQIALQQKNSNEAEIQTLQYELDQIRTDFENLEDQKSSIQQKLTNAEAIFNKNIELQQQLQKITIQLKRKEQLLLHNQSQHHKEVELLQQSIQLNTQQHLVNRQINHTIKNQINEQINEKNEQTEVLKRQENFQQEKQEYLMEIDKLLQNIEIINGQNLEKQKQVHFCKQQNKLLHEQNQLLQQKFSDLNQALQKSQDQIKQYQLIVNQIASERQYFEAIRKELQNNQKDKSLTHQEDMQQGYEFIKLTVENEEKHEKIEQLQKQLSRCNKQILQKSINIQKLSHQKQQSIIQQNNSKAEIINLRLKLNNFEHEKQLALQEILQVKSQKFDSLENNQNDHHKKQSQQNDKKQYDDMMKLIREKEINIAKRYQELEQKERQLQIIEISLLKRQEQLKILERDIALPLHSHLGIQSVRQSYTNFPNHQMVSSNSFNDSYIERLKEELESAKNIITENAKVLHLKQSEFDALVCRQKDLKQILQSYLIQQRQLKLNLDQQKSEYSQLFSQLKQVEQKNMQILLICDKLKEQKFLLNQKLQELNALLFQSETRSKHIMEQQAQDKIEKQQVIKTLERQVQIYVNGMRQKESLLSQKEDSFQQQEAIIRKLSAQVQQKQTLIKQMEKGLKSKKQQIELNSQKLNEMNENNSKLLSQIEIINLKCLKVENELKNAVDQKEKYSERLNEIEDIIEQLKKQEESNRSHKEQLFIVHQQKSILELKLTQLEDQQLQKNDCIVVLQNSLRQKALQLSTARHQIDQSQLKIEINQSQHKRLQQSIKLMKHQLKKYEDIGTVTYIKQQLLQLEQLAIEMNQAKSKIKFNDKSLISFKNKIEEKQGQISHLSKELEIALERVSKLQQQCSKKTVLQPQQKEDLEKKINLLQKSVEQLKEELTENNIKIEQIKQNSKNIQTEKQLAEDQLKQKQAEIELLVKQINHYKSEMKRINKQKVLVQSEMNKCKFNLQQQQTVIKVRENSLSNQVKKKEDEKAEVINKLKQEIQMLKQENSILTNKTPSLNSELKFISKNRDDNKNSLFEDYPLQTTSRSRQKSVKLPQELKMKDKYQQQLQIVDKYRQILEQQNKYLKSEVTKMDKNSTKTRQIQKTNTLLNNEIQLLKDQIKSKSSNLENLQKQFKGKIEQYSKLQRIIESLNDELSLERKRVKNFEDLYKNIQEKKGKSESFIFKNVNYE